MPESFSGTKKTNGSINEGDRPYVDASGVDESEDRSSGRLESEKSHARQRRGRKAAQAVDPPKEDKRFAHLPSEWRAFYKAVSRALEE